MMSNKRIILSIALSVFLSATIKAQQNTHISMNEAIEKAEENNLSIRQSELAHRIAHAEFLQTNAIFLPQLSVGYTAIATNNPLNAFGFLLQQSRVTQADFNPDKLNSPGTAYNYGASADVKVPLLNLDMIYARKGAKLREDMLKQQGQFTKSHVKFEVQKAYTQLQFAYEARNILEETLTDVKTIRQTVENFYEQGLIQKSDVLNADVQVNTIESALAKANSNIANASEALLLLMNNKEGTTPLTPDPLTMLSSGNNAYMFSASRSDIIAMQRALEATEMMVKSQKMNFLPKLNAFGSYQFNDKKIFQFKSDSYMAGINLSWNIYSGHQNTNKLRAARLQHEDMKLKLQQHIDQSKLEVDKTNRDLADIMFEVKQHDSSVKQAEEALRIMTNRYREGLVNTTDLLSSQAQYSKQQLEKAQAIMNYNITRYYQELLTTIK